MRAAKLRQQRGVVAIIVVLSLVAIGAFMALALNMGHVVSLRGELQNAADSAALAGAKELNGTSIKCPTALQRATTFGGLHTTDTNASSGVPVEPEVVDYGHWDRNLPKKDAYTPLACDDTTARQVNAVRVRAARAKDVAGGGAMNVAFGGAFLASKSTDVAAEAVAAGGGPCSEKCPNVPIAMFDCDVLVSDVLNCNKEFVMTYNQTNPAPTDNMGWSTLQPDTNACDSASTTTYRNIFERTDTCSIPTACQSSVGTVIAVSNGSQWTPLCSYLEYLYNNAIKFTAPIVHKTCPPQINQGAEIVGYATFTITALNCQGNPKYMRVRIDCSPPPDKKANDAGCAFYGTTSAVPRLVR